MSDRLVARFWNEDGYEMPSLYERDGELICTWNYLLLVAPPPELEWTHCGYCETPDDCEDDGCWRDALAAEQRGELICPGCHGKGFVRPKGEAEDCPVCDGEMFVEPDEPADADSDPRPDSRTHPEFWTE